MHLLTTALALTAVLPSVVAAPSGDAPTRPLMRLVKTSESDPGQWVTEQQKFELFTSKNIGFIDITDIKDDEVLSVLSAADSSDVARRAVTYPSSPQHVDEANKLIAKASNTGPQSWLKTLTNFNTRHYRSSTGREASDWLFNQVKKTASANSAITVKQFTHRSFNQPSIIAQLPGSSSELIVIGAHMDSTGGSSSARSPGADDNGSGSVVVLEALRVLAESGFKPENTIEFHWYAGEEGGLLGSQEVWSSYKSSRKNALAFLNQDMTGYSPSGKPAVFTDYVDSALTQYVRTIVTQYTGQTPSTSRCGYACSDHGSARSNGFPAAFVSEDTFENSNPNIHSANDSLDKIMWPSILRHSKLTIGFLVEASYI